MVAMTSVRRITKPYLHRSAFRTSTIKAWEGGFIDLNGRTLGDAAAEFNRYNRQVVVISDPRLSAQTWSAASKPLTPSPS
jgi:ferric-dicitrate binding protein FerR (iron transport regulator)